jgi:hypothetical protein
MFQDRQILEKPRNNSALWPHGAHDVLFSMNVNEVGVERMTR